MKTLLKRYGYFIIALGVMGWGAILTFAQSEKSKKEQGRVDITSDSIVIHPTVQLSPAEEKKFAEVIGRYKESLYYVDKLENGKVTEPKGDSGRLAKLSKELKAEIADAKARGATCWEVGFVPVGVGLRKETPTAESTKLLEETKPILQQHQ